MLAIPFFTGGKCEAAGVGVKEVGFQVPLCHSLREPKDIDHLRQVRSPVASQLSSGLLPGGSLTGRCPFKLCPGSPEVSA